MNSLEGFLQKINGIQDMYHNNSNNLEATFVKLTEKKKLSRNLLMIGNNSLKVTVLPCGGQKIEEIVSLLMRYENK